MEYLGGYWRIIHTTLEFDLVEPPPDEFRAVGADGVLFVAGWEWIGVGPNGTIVCHEV